MAAVLGSMDTITSLMSNVWTMMASNALLTLFLATGLISVGVSVFLSIKRAALLCRDNPVPDYPGDLSAAGMPGIVVPPLPRLPSSCLK